MSEIKKGDLVMVIRPSSCCGGGKSVGLVRTVTRIMNGAPGTCTGCGRHFTHGTSAVLSGDAPWAQWNIGVDRLKKIEPPTDQMRREEGLINKVEA
jgi:hypothetical protein